MKTSIFKDAKPGDKYLTREGKIWTFKKFSSYEDAGCAILSYNDEVIITSITGKWNDFPSKNDIVWKIPQHLWWHIFSQQYWCFLYQKCLHIFKCFIGVSMKSN